MPDPDARAARRGRGILLGMILSLLPALLPAAERVELKLGNAPAVSLTAFLRDGERLFLPFPEAVTALGLSGFADPATGALFIRAPGKLIVISPQGLAAVENRTFPQTFPPRREQGALYLPKDFFTGPLAEVMGRPITVQRIPEANPAGPLQMSTRQAAVRLVVIDPGHGGDDEGAHGPGGLFEKNLTLKLALMLRSELARDRTLRVVLTRESDTQVELGKRAELANHLQADLFISIHANAAKTVGAAGFETFFVSLKATDDEARKLAALENVTLGVKAAPDPRANDLELILGDMAQAEHLADSEAFAAVIQERLSQVMQTENRGVKQAPFSVLMQAAMPAVLVEVGFLSNQNEARSITRPETQRKIVQALAQSVFSFRDRQARQLGVPVNKLKPKSE